MQILNFVGCVCVLGLASICAVPVGTLCASIGFTGVAALVGAVAVLTIVQ